MFSGAWLPLQGRLYQASLFFVLHFTIFPSLHFTIPEYYTILLMNTFTLFSNFFQKKALLCLHEIIDLAFDEDGEDLTSNAVFPLESLANACVIAKEDFIVAGLPIIKEILKRTSGESKIVFHTNEGSQVQTGSKLISIHGHTRKILKSERIILNMLSKLSGIASQTDKFCKQLSGSKVRLLDTRKTTPGLRYPEKYAVLVGGAENHRLNLQEMLMLKDNHIDHCGSITKAVNLLRKAYSPCPAIEVECRTINDVQEAVQAKVQRIMLDNMSHDEMQAALEFIPQSIESEISGRITLDNLKQTAELNPDFISSGALTHSARSVDISMTITPA